ncbi:MAG: transglutaminase-like domain-containing protein [Fimbriimonadaceae bacterium]
MRRVLCFVLVAVSSLGLASTEYLGIFMNSQKIGYSSSLTVPDVSYGAEVRADSYSVMNMALLGTDMKIEIWTKSWSSNQKPKRIESKMSSAGRTQIVIADFKGNVIELQIDNAGSPSKKTLALPKDGDIVDDAINMVWAEGAAVGSKRAFYVLDPMTASLVKNEIKLLGNKSITINGKSITANAVEMSEPRSTMTAYFSSKGDLIKLDGPMGIEMIPMTAEDAMADAPKSTGSTDIGFSNAIRPSKSLGIVEDLTGLTLKVTGKDLSRLPSDHRQSVTKSGPAWLIKLSPEKANKKTTIAAASKAQPKWTKPGLNVPSDDPSMVRLARSIIGKEQTVAGASERVRQYVMKIMVPNAGIGIIRDAREVLKTKEGVCRDYAILTATLMRAVSIPSRVASGLVYQDGQYYYHAWVEAWDGKQWVGVDSTRPGSVGMGHKKLAQGSVEDAFTFPFLGNVTMEVVDAKRKP